MKIIISALILASAFSIKTADKDIVPAPAVSEVTNGINLTIVRQPERVDLDQEHGVLQGCYDCCDKCDHSIQKCAVSYTNCLTCDYCQAQYRCTECQKRVCCLTSPCTAPLIFVGGAVGCACGIVKLALSCVLPEK